MKIMNILFSSPNFNYACGVSRHVYNLILELSQISHYNIILFTNGGDALERLNGLQNLKIEKFYYSSTIKNIFNLPRNWLIAKKIIKGNRINVIHTHHRYPELIFALLPAKNKMVNTVHSFVSGWKLFSFHSKVQIAVSHSVKNMIINDFSKSEKDVKVIYNFIEELRCYTSEEKFAIREKNSIPLTTKLLFFAGRISYVKGIDLLVDSLSEIGEKYNIFLIMIGSVEKKMEEYLKQKSRKSFMILPPQNDIQDLLAMCDAVILPSRVDPFPYLMLEAGIAKKLFIGSKVDGIDELVQNNVDGILFENGNKQELESTLINWLENKYNEEKLINNLNKKVKSLCDKKDYISQLISIYESLNDKTRN